MTSLLLGAPGHASWPSPLTAVGNKKASEFVAVVLHAPGVHLPREFKHLAEIGFRCAPRGIGLEVKAEIFAVGKLHIAVSISANHGQRAAREATAPLPLRIIAIYKYV